MGKKIKICSIEPLLHVNLTPHRESDRGNFSVCFFTHAANTVDCLSACLRSHTHTQILRVNSDICSELRRTCERGFSYSLLCWTEANISKENWWLENFKTLYDLSKLLTLICKHICELISDWHQWKLNSADPRLPLTGDARGSDTFIKSSDVCQGGEQGGKLMTCSMNQFWMYFFLSVKSSARC